MRPLALSRPKGTFRLRERDGQWVVEWLIPQGVLWDYYPSRVAAERSADRQRKERATKLP